MAAFRIPESSDAIPVRPKRPCLNPRCPKLVDTGYCDEHKRAEQKRDTERRGTAASRGYDSRWQKARASYLRSHPICVECQREHRITAASVVDHVVPHRGSQRLFWDENNWQSLCRTHHNAKTAGGG